MELMKLEWSRTCEQGERLMSKEPLASSTRPVDQPALLPLHLVLLHIDQLLKGFCTHVAELHLL